MLPKFFRRRSAIASGFPIQSMGGFSGVASFQKRTYKTLEKVFGEVDKCIDPQRLFRREIHEAEQELKRQRAAREIKL